MTVLTPEGQKMIDELVAQAFAPYIAEIKRLRAMIHKKSCSGVECGVCGAWAQTPKEIYHNKECGVMRPEG